MNTNATPQYLQLTTQVYLPRVKGHFSQAHLTSTSSSFFHSRHVLCTLSPIALYKCVQHPGKEGRKREKKEGKARVVVLGPKLLTLSGGNVGIRPLRPAVPTQVIRFFYLFARIYMYILARIYIFYFPFY